MRGSGGSWRSLALGAVVSAWLGCGTAGAIAAPGQPDSEFGHRGIVRMDVNRPAGNAEDRVAVDAQGRIIVLATGSDRRSVLLRLRPSGALDPSFGSDGGSTPVPGGPWRDLGIQPDGHIVLAGSAEHEIALARYDEDGSLDAAFGGGTGIVTTHVDLGESGAGISISERLEAVAIQADGRIVAVGDVDRCNSKGRECESGDGFVARYEPGGTPDSSFGSGGISRSASSPRNGLGRIDALALAPSGKILVGGSNGNIAIARLNPSGSLDGSFARNGVMTTGLDTLVEEEIGTYGDARALAVRPDGRIVAAGEMIILGLTPEGNLDPHFGSGGSVPDTGGGLYENTVKAEDALVDAKGRVLVAGKEGGRAVVTRYLPNGKRDPRFAGDGIAYVRRSSRGQRLGAGMTGLALAPDGRVLAAGFAPVGKRRELTLAGLHGGGGRLARCHGRLAALQGTPGADRLVGEGPVVAFGGNDEIVGYGGPVCAGAGADTINQPGPGPVYAGPGNDRIVSAGHGPVFGGPGDDVIRSRKGEEVADRFFGGPGADLLSGGIGPDRLVGGGGADTLVGGKGPDRLLGGPGTDTLLQGPTNPPPAVYQANRPGFRIRLTVRGHRLTGLHYAVRLHCVRSSKTEHEEQDDNHYGLKIDATGRFRFRESGRDLEETNYGLYLAGRVRPRTVVGAFGELGEYGDGPCLTGRPGHRVLHFTARRVNG